MMKKACQYALLRFRPFIETGEFANVGVVLMAADGSFFGFRLLEKSYAHITQFFHPLKKEIYLNGKNLFKEELERFANEMAKHCVSDLPLARQMFTGLVQARETMFHFSEMRVVLCEHPQHKLDEFFSYYVERGFVTKEYQEQTLEKHIQDMLVRAELKSAYKKQKIEANGFTVTLPFVKKNEGLVERVIKPLYLAQDDATTLLNHGDDWTQKIKRLQKRRALPAHILFPLAAPLPESATYNDYLEIKTELEGLGVVTVAANDESAITAFAGMYR